MQLRLMATYLGVPYQAGLGPDGTEATLFSPGPPPDELGFTAVAGHWRKQVGVTDLDAVWQTRPTGNFRGEPCLVLDDLGDRLHIAYLGRDATRAAQLGYWEIDREVFEVVVARHDVIALTEERVDFPLTAAMFPAPGGQPHGEAEPPAPTPAGYGCADHAPAMPDRMAAWHGSPEPWPAPGVPVEGTAVDGAVDGAVDWAVDWAGDGAGPQSEGPQGGTEETAPPPRRRTGRRDRISPEPVFAELLSLAAIPQAAYAVDEEVPGAMCLVEADGGFEVFSRTDDARLEVHFFEDEEAAYFYLFGVLAAEAVRSGRLGPSGSAGANGYDNVSVGNVSKYLRGRK